MRKVGSEEALLSYGCSGTGRDGCEWDYRSNAKRREYKGV
jgi:hypothetical protein